jgi:hypothetical protein
MDLNTLLWAALILFMVACCGMMMRMAMKNPPNDKPSDTTDHRNDSTDVNQSDEEKQ